MACIRFFPFFCLLLLYKPQWLCTDKNTRNRPKGGYFVGSNYPSWLWSAHSCTWNFYLVRNLNSYTKYGLKFAAFMSWLQAENKKKERNKQKTLIVQGEFLHVLEVEIPLSQSQVPTATHKQFSGSFCH